MLPIADKDVKWSKQAAVKRVRAFTDSTDEPSAEYADAFFYVAGDGSMFGQYKLPFADVIDGKLTAIPNAIESAYGALNGAMGGVNIPSADLQKVKDKVQAYRSHLGLSDDKKETKSTEVSELLWRDSEIESIERTADPELRTISLSFSSENPVERSYGLEILDHSPESVDLSRLNAAGPVLLDHDTRKQVGVVKTAFISPDRKGRALVQFSKGQLGSEVWQDITDGIRKNVSVGYQVSGKPQVQGNTYRFMSWQPSHISLVAEPADCSVGINRSLEKPVLTEPQINTDSESLTKGAAQMTAEVKEKEINPADVVTAERKRVADIQTAAAKFKTVSEIQELATKACHNDLSVQDFQLEAFRILETKNAANRAEPKDAKIGLTQREAQGFSLSKMVNYLMNPDSKKYQTEAGFEIEVSRATRDKFGATRGGMSFSIPFEVTHARPRGQQLRTTYVDASTAADLIQTTVEMGSFIDVLRNSCQVSNLGATHLDGLTSTVQIPRMSAASTAYWLATDVSGVTESAPTFDDIVLSPHTLVGNTYVSRQALTQVPGIDAILNQDLARTSGVALDYACINGAGSSGVPKGIFQLSSIPTVSLGASGGPPTYAAILSMIGDLAVANALMGKLAFLGEAYGMETMASTLKASSVTTANYILGGLNGDLSTLAGYPFVMSNNVPSNFTKSVSGLSGLIFGNWQDAIIASWGTTEILVDPYTGAANNSIYLYSFGQYDFNVRHLGSFSVIVDMVTPNST